jgi:hypothetical protein
MLRFFGVTFVSVVNAIQVTEKKRPVERIANQLGGNVHPKYGLSTSAPKSYFVITKT